MKIFTGIIIVASFFLACNHNESSVGPDEVTNDNPFIGCWEFLSSEELTNSGWIPNLSEEVGSDTLYFTDSTWIGHFHDYILNEFTGEYGWTNLGVDFGNYTYSSDTLWLQDQTDLAHPVPYEYKISNDTLTLNPNEKSVSGTIEMFIKESCVL